MSLLIVLLAFQISTKLDIIYSIVIYNYFIYKTNYSSNFVMWGKGHPGSILPHMTKFEKCRGRSLKVIYLLMWRCYVSAIMMINRSTHFNLKRVFISSSVLSSIFSHYVLYHQSPFAYMCCCCSQFSSNSLQLSVNAVLPLHYRSYSPLFPLHFMAIWSLCQFSSSILSTWSAHFYLLITYLKILPQDRSVVAQTEHWGQFVFCSCRSLLMYFFHMFF